MLDSAILQKKITARTNTVLADAAKTARQQAIFDELASAIHGNPDLKMQDLLRLRRSSTFQKLFQEISIMEFLAELGKRLNPPKVTLAVPKMEPVTIPGAAKAKSEDKAWKILAHLITTNGGTYSKTDLLALVSGDDRFQGLQGLNTLEAMAKTAVRQGLIMETGRGGETVYCRIPATKRK